MEDIPFLDEHPAVSSSGAIQPQSANNADSVDIPSWSTVVEQASKNLSARVTESPGARVTENPSARVTENSSSQVAEYTTAESPSVSVPAVQRNVSKGQLRGMEA